MADIRAKLIEALNGKAPQHKVEGEDRFEASEGSNGSLHVKDKEVLSRLNSLEKKIDSVIENGSVNTRLNGSNVEEVVNTNFTVTAGNTMDMGTLELDGVNQISIGLRLSIQMNSPDIKILYRWRSKVGLSDNSHAEFEYEVSNTGNYIRMITKRLTLVTNRVGIYIENKSGYDVDASRLEVFKYV